MFRERAAAPAEYLVARPELLDLFAHRLDPSRNIDSRYLAPRPPQSGHQAHDVGLAPHQMPVADVDGCRTHSYEHLFGFDDRLVDVSELQDIR